MNSHTVFLLYLPILMASFTLSEKKFLSWHIGMKNQELFFSFHVEYFIMVDSHIFQQQLNSQCIWQAAKKIHSNLTFFS